MGSPDLSFVQLCTVLTASCLQICDNWLRVFLKVKEVKVFTALNVQCVATNSGCGRDAALAAKEPQKDRVFSEKYLEHPVGSLIFIPFALHTRPKGAGQSGLSPLYRLLLGRGCGISLVTKNTRGSTEYIWPYD